MCESPTGPRRSPQRGRFNAVTVYRGGIARRRKLRAAAQKSWAFLQDIQEPTSMNLS
jgi:hypothetical protein